jgi:hypothetical protein
MPSRQLLASVILLATLAPLVAAGSLRPNELTLGGGISESEGLSVSSMSLWLRRDSPGVAFGMSRGAVTPWAYSYLLLIKGDPRRERLAGHNSTCSSDGQTATGGGHVEINGVRADVAYSLRIGPQGKQDLVEGITINGKAFDLGQGRVFLVDLSGGPARVRQVNTDLPRPAVTPKTPKEVDRLAREHLKRLRKQSAAVRVFLK